MEEERARLRISESFDPDMGELEMVLRVKLWRLILGNGSSPIIGRCS
jgi:hypothetical protein